MRLPEAKLDRRVVDLFRRIRQPEPVRETFKEMLRDWAAQGQQECCRDSDDSRRHVTVLRRQQDQQLSLRLLQEVDSESYGRKAAELRDRIATLAERTRADDAGRQEKADVASKVFELSQASEEDWVAAIYVEKRQLLETVCLNYRLDDATQVT